VVAVGGGETFAEALYRAKKLYENLGNADRASLIDQRMNQLCPNSPWTKR
jgi:outer membrane protein assembly factor BamD (BamD/ComL family)